ncbi:MAG: hypothetical protein IPI90_08805 [Saprospiraceae bacterium]|nr:hypothetical protein [Candidatus Vicinibacter affinis]
MALLFIYLFFGCTKSENIILSPCEEVIKLEDIKPYGQSFSWLPSEKDSQVIFKNESGKELVFSYNGPIQQTLLSNHVSKVVCKEDSSLNQIITYQILRNSLRLSNFSNAEFPVLAFIYELTVLYDEFHPLKNNRLDVFRIYSVLKDQVGVEQRDLLLEIPLYNRNYDYYQDQSKQLPIVNFGLRSYSDVYTKSGVQDPGVYFNKQFGVVAFKTSDGDLWVRW